MNIDAARLETLSDPHRMHVLASIDLDDPRLRHDLNAITERTAHRLGLPISMASIVLDTAQFLAGSYGVDGWIGAVQGTPVEWSFCVNAVMSRQPYVVPDATTDTLQASNPVVIVDGFHSYAGVPLHLDGEVLGAHCVIGNTAHAFTDDDLTELQRGADEIVTLLQQYRRPLP